MSQYRIDIDTSSQLASSSYLPKLVSLSVNQYDMKRYRSLAVRYAWTVSRRESILEACLYITAIISFSQPFRSYALQAKNLRDEFNVREQSVDGLDLLYLML